MAIHQIYLVAHLCKPGNYADYVAGVGIGYIVLNALVCIYYNVIIALSLYYLFGSFQAVLPWSTCDNEWNTENCGDPSIQGKSVFNLCFTVLRKIIPVYRLLLFVQDQTTCGALC